MQATWQESYTEVKEHAKSNTHQLAEIKASLKDIQERQRMQNESLIKIRAVVVEDGFVAAVKENSKSLKEFRGEFKDFLIHRYETCPVQSKKESDRNWTATLFRVLFASIGALSTLIIIIDKLLSVI